MRLIVTIRDVHKIRCPLVLVNPFIISISDNDTVDNNARRKKNISAKISQNLKMLNFAILITRPFMIIQGERPNNKLSFDP